MKKTKTLKKNYEFRRVLSKGTYYNGDYIGAYIIKSRDHNQYIGFAVGVKIANAPRRNKIKRLLRENYRLMEDNINTGYSIVFLWKKSVNIKYATFDNIKKDMTKIFEKARILREV